MTDAQAAQARIEALEKQQAELWEWAQNIGLIISLDELKAYLEIED